MWEDEKITRVILQDVVDFFGLGKIHTFERSAFGNANTTFLIRTVDGFGYALRLLGGKTDEPLLENERQVQYWLAEKSVPTTQMLPSSKGAFLFDRDGLRATVSKLIVGQHPTYPVAKEECGHIGKTLARFHAGLRGMTLPHPEVENTLSRHRVYEEIGNLPQTEYARRIIELLSRSTLDHDSLPAGIIHGDFHINNILRGEGDIFFVLDLQGVSMGPLILDIGRSIADVCCDADKLDLDKLHIFLSGYESIRPMTSIEKRVIYKAIRYGAVAASLSLYQDNKPDFANHFLNLGYTVPPSP